VRSDDFGMFDDFDRQSSEAQMMYKTLPDKWEDQDIIRDIEDRLRVPVPPGLSGEDLKWMWVQVSIMMRPEKPQKVEGATGWEYWRYERPRLNELYNFYRENFKTERQNLLQEYCEDPPRARERYGDSADYVEIMNMIQNIMNTPAKKTPKIRYAGFPSMLDEETIRNTFTEFGEIVELQMTPAADEMGDVSGTVEFDSTEAAQKAIAQWNGVDMGMGMHLKIEMID